MSTRRHRPLLTTALLIGVLALGPVACGHDAGRISLAAAPTTTVTAPTTTFATPDATTTTSVPTTSHVSEIANVRPDVQSVVVHDSPGGPQLQLDTAGDGALRAVAIDHPLPSGAPTTFLVKGPAVAAGGRDWIEVYLPVRPNGSTGWIAASDVVVTTTEMAATIDLATHQLRLTEAGEVVATYPIAAGEAATPTPTGRFYVKELVEPPDADGAYGPIAYGLSAFSPTLVDTDAFADGVIGIHGTNRPDLLGGDVSHGCVRVRNEDVLDLERRQVPLGMPVTITA